MIDVRTIWTAILLALCGSPALAKQAAPAGDIVVTALKAREIHETALAVTAPGNLQHEPMAQFQLPVCPGVIGISPELGAMAVARIREVAKQAKVRLASDKCKVNLLVAFVPNGQAAMRNLLQEGPWLFGDLTPADLFDLARDPQLKDLAADPGPVHAWVNTEPRSRYGAVLTGRGDLVEPAVLKIVGSPSRIHMGARRDIVSSMVVIDFPATIDMSITQIADYAAMRGLVRTRPPGQAGEVGTILGLFDKGSIPPEEMTGFDRAYLRAAYGSMPDIPAIHKVGRVAYEMKRGTDKEQIP